MIRCCFAAKSLSNAAISPLVDQLGLPNDPRHEAAPALRASCESGRQVVGGLHSLIVSDVVFISSSCCRRYHLLMFASSIRHSSRLSIVVLAKSEFAGNRSNAICACCTAPRAFRACRAAASNWRFAQTFQARTARPDTATTRSNTLQSLPCTVPGRTARPLRACSSCEASCPSAGRCGYRAS